MVLMMFIIQIMWQQTTPLDWFVFVMTYTNESASLD